MARCSALTFSCHTHSHSLLFSTPFLHIVPSLFGTRFRCHFIAMMLMMCDACSVPTQSATSRQPTGGTPSGKVRVPPPHQLGLGFRRCIVVWAWICCFLFRRPPSSAAPGILCPHSAAPQSQIHFYFTFRCHYRHPRDRPEFGKEV